MNESSEQIKKVKDLCNHAGISVRKLERDLGFSNGSIASCKTLSADRLYKIAGYFSVTPEYLLGRESTVEDTMQHAFDDCPEMRILFSVAKDAPVEDIEYVVQKLQALKDNK